MKLLVKVSNIFKRSFLIGGAELGEIIPFPVWINLFPVVKTSSLVKVRKIWQNYNIRTNLKFGKFVPKNFQKISFLKILENRFQYSTTRHVCPMIEESIMEHTCLPDDRVDQRGISHMSVIKLIFVSFHKLIYLLNTFTLEKIDFAIKV